MCRTLRYRTNTKQARIHCLQPFFASSSLFGVIMLELHGLQCWIATSDNIILPETLTSTGETDVVNCTVKLNGRKVQNNLDHSCFPPLGVLMKLHRAMSSTGRLWSRSRHGVKFTPRVRQARSHPQRPPARWMLQSLTRKPEIGRAPV